MEDAEENLIPVTLDLNNATFIHLNTKETEKASLKQEDLLKFSDAIVTLEDGSQWYKIPLEEDPKSKEVFIQDVEEEWEEAKEVQNEEVEEGTTTISSIMQVVVLEDGTIGYLQPNDSEEPAPVEKKPAKKKERSYQCNEPGCGRSYTSFHHLKVHVRNHTGDRPYKCTVEGCEKAFATDYSRKAHIRTHTGEKPYPCPFSLCLKSFKTSGDLQKHIRTHTGERPFTCPVLNCHKTFTTSNIRKIHIRTHTGERPYTCTFEGCERSFASSTNFKNHMRIHSGEKPYLCIVENCGKRFTEYSSLYKHNLVHLQVKNYHCAYCLKAYRQLSTLTSHKRTIHGVIAADDGTEIILEQMRVGKDGSKSFKNITSNLLNLKRDSSAAEETEGDIYIIPSSDDDIAGQFRIEESVYESLDF